MANEGQCIFMNIDQGTLGTKWVGEAEKKARILFEIARFWAPVIIFIDEIDSLLGQRGAGGDDKGAAQGDKMKTQFLVEMEGVASGPVVLGKMVTLVGATNNPWALDEALIRRLGTRVYIPLPDFAARVAMWKLFTKGVPNLDYDELSRLSDGYSGSGLKVVCNTAHQYPLQAALNKTAFVGPGVDRNEKLRRLQEQEQDICDSLESHPPTMEEYTRALDAIKPNKSTKLEEYHEWYKSHGAG